MSEQPEHQRLNDIRVMDADGPDALVRVLTDRGFTVIGPKVIAEAMLQEPYEPGDLLPFGWTDEQDGGRYRLTSRGDKKLFDYVVGPQGWKRWLHPPRQRLWTATAAENGFTVDAEHPDDPPLAFFGARACEIAAIAVQDRVFDNGDFTDPIYNARRAKAFVVAVDCSRAASTCFCASMETGPATEDGYDIRLSEIHGAGRHVVLARAGSKAGADILDHLDLPAATSADIEAAAAISKKTAAAQHRAMPSEAAAILGRNLEHPRWADVAARCLGCGSCTMVCPTCFCTGVEDVTGLDPNVAERWRHWDSCFSIDFSYIHGGAIRQDAASRYRQWITHKLAHWHDQFGTSGCVGCGRCITWCPVGIDIVEETTAIRDTEHVETLHG